MGSITSGAGLDVVGCKPLALLSRLGSWLAGETSARPRLHTDDAPYQLALAHGALHRMRLEAGGTLQCLEGSLWITLDGEPVDHVIEAGQALSLPAGTRAVAYALAPAVIHVCFTAARGRLAMAGPHRAP
jgi:hypothetical protein